MRLIALKVNKEINPHETPYEKLHRKHELFNFT